MNTKTRENLVFKVFIAFCVLMTALVFYILIDRPVRVVVEASNTDSDLISFKYDKSEHNLSIEEFIKKAKGDSHVIVIHYAPTHKLISNYKLDHFEKAFKKCGNILPCEVIQFDKKSFLEKAKKRKDIKKGS